MMSVMKVFGTEVGRSWMKNSFNKSVWGGIREVIKADIIWLICREEIAVDTFDANKSKEEQKKLSGSVILNWLFSNKIELGGSLF